MPSLTEIYRDYAQFARCHGFTVNVDGSHGTVAIDRPNGESCFLRGDEGWSWINMMIKIWADASDLSYGDARYGYAWIYIKTFFTQGARNMKPSKIKVKPMRNAKGSIVKNQYLIFTPEGVYFQSYDTVIAFRPGNRFQAIVLDKHNWDYSTTTSKYRNLFLGEDTKTTRKKIEDGIYLLARLNF